MHVQTSTTAPLYQIFEPNKSFSFVSNNNSSDVEAAGDRLRQECSVFVTHYRERKIEFPMCGYSVKMWYKYDSVSEAKPGGKSSLLSACLCCCAEQRRLLCLI